MVVDITKKKIEYFIETKINVVNDQKFMMNSYT
jgi:hypothetical protein